MRANIDHEEGIVWVRPDWASLPYVREKVALTHRRSARPKWPKHERLVGYATLKSGCRSAAPGVFWRRVWVLHDLDFERDAYGYVNAAGLVCDAPSEGVLPTSVTAGCVSAPAYLVLKADPVPRPILQRRA